MQLPSLAGHAAQLFKIIWKSPQPADSLASEYFRSKKYIGSKERRFLSETVFAALRMKGLAEFAATAAFTTIGAPPQEALAHEMAIILATLLLGARAGAFEPGALLKNVPQSNMDAGDGFKKLVQQAAAEKLGLDEESAARFLKAVEEAFNELDAHVEELLKKGELSDEEIELVAARYACPAWILKEWKSSAHHERTWADAAQMAESLLKSAPVGLRVNTQMLSRDEALARLHSDGVAVRVGALSPSAIVLQERVALQQNELFLSGAVEVQDEGSQLIGYALAPQPEWEVLDACAGAGGKTLHIAALQGDRGEVLATDIEFNRLKEIGNRARRAGLTSIQTKLLGKKERTLPERLHESFDAVLVDAPCSGMGTVRRMPMAKWRLTPELLKKHSAKQLMILTEYAQFVAPGGVLVYATCSMMPEENDRVVERFLKDNPDFEPEPLSEVFKSVGVNVGALKQGAATLSLSPGEHGTDGFFMGRLRRSG